METTEVKKDFSTIVAEVLSIVFHPVLIPSYSLILLMLADPVLNNLISLKIKFILLAFVFSGTAIIPVFLILLLKKKKVISSVYLHDRVERITPLAGTTILFYLVYNMLSNSGLPAIISLMSLVSAFLALAILIITLFWKISIHTTAMGGMLASFFCISGELSISPVIICAVLILLCGLVAFSRIKTNAHQPAQVYTGFLMGILITGLFFYFMY